jgi:hypothetical protein
MKRAMHGRIVGTGWIAVAAVALAFSAACGNTRSSAGWDGGSELGDGGVEASDGGVEASGGGVEGGDDGRVLFEASGCPPCDPGAVNFPGDSCDYDCSGTHTPHPCDQDLSAAGPASDFAKAIGICQLATAQKWGLVSATYTRGYNSQVAPNDAQHGILPKFGSVIKPREGFSLGVLSSGTARECDDLTITDCSGSGLSDPWFKGGQSPMYNGPGSAPPNYPKPAQGCTNDTNVLDTIGVTLTIKVPTNAKAFSFDFDFYSSEWPEFVCTRFNDSFVAWLDSAAWQGVNGDLNISSDSRNNPISVNNAFFDRCTPNTPTGCQQGVMPTGMSACPGGPSELQGTGFYNLGTYCISPSAGGGATGWLTTTANVQGGEQMTIQFIIWDTGDVNWDSSVLLDNFRWLPMAGSGTGRVQ